MHTITQYHTDPLMPQSFIDTLYDQFNLSKREVDLVLCHVLNVNTAGLYIYHQEISQEQQNDIIKLLEKRAKGIPLAYLTGQKSFWTLDLMVNEHTLIPRPETELLIELLLNWCNDDFSGTVLDLGTGTGAIALSFAESRPHATVHAVDFCQHCVTIAKKNQDKHHLTNVKIQHSNWFSALSSQKFDFIVSNPPYVAEGDPHLSALKHEPITALTAPNNGLADLFHIIDNAPKHLNNNARLMLEHGHDQHQAVQNHLQTRGYKEIVSHKDLAGINRVTSALFTH